MNNLIKIILIILVLNFLFKNNNKMEKFGEEHCIKYFPMGMFFSKHTDKICKDSDMKNDFLNLIRSAEMDLKCPESTPDSATHILQDEKESTPDSTNPISQDKEVGETTAEEVGETTAEEVGETTAEEVGETIVEEEVEKQETPVQIKYPIPQTIEDADKLNEEDLFNRLILHKIKNCSTDADCVYGGCDKKIGKCYSLPCQNHSDCSFDNKIRAGYCYVFKGQSTGYCDPFDKEDCQDVGNTAIDSDHIKCRNKKGETNKCLRYWSQNYNDPSDYKHKCVSNSEYDDAESKRDIPCIVWLSDYQKQCGDYLNCKTVPNSSDTINGKCN